MATHDLGARIDARLDRISEQMALLVRVSTRGNVRLGALEKQQAAFRERQEAFEGALRALIATVGRLTEAQRRSQEEMRAFRKEARMREKRLDARLNALIVTVEKHIAGGNGRGRAGGDGRG